jgi:hypothetical protein
MGSGCYACGLWLPTGLNIGAGPRWQDGEGKADLFLGGEVSLIDLRRARERDGWFLGGYGDVLYDLRAHRFRASLGPESVYLKHSADYFFGVDLGAVAESGDGGTRWGARFRAFLPLAVITPYVGFTRLMTHEPASLIEAGLLLKLPFHLSD